MKLVVFGATGRTGRHVVETALENGHDVTAFVRDPAKLDLDHENLRVVVGDAYTGEGVAEAIEGGPADDKPADAVISVLGQSKSTPDDLLTVAGRHILDAMEAGGVDRFVTLVGAGVRTEDESVSLGGKVMGGLLKLVSRAVLTDAEAHVADVRSRDFRWTVVRVPRLGDGDPRGEYQSGEDLKLGFEAVERADVASFMLDVVEADRYVGDLPKVGY